MGIRIDKKRTDAYIGTFHYGCADDMLQLEELRAMVRNMNRSLREAKMDYQFRVKLQGRGENRFERAKEYYTKKYSGRLNDRSIKHRVAQSLPLECAEKVDAYILRRK